MKHLIRFALVALFIAPFSLSAERSIMDPVVYDLRGALTAGYEVAAVVTDAGELSEFTFDTAKKLPHVTQASNVLLCLVCRYSRPIGLPLHGS